MRPTLLLWVVLAAPAAIAGFWERSTRTSLSSEFQKRDDSSDEVLSTRTYFYVGGSYINSTSPGGQFYVHQMYVERLVPHPVKQKYPLIFISGGSQTGTNWLNTPDGRQGWASYFLSKGYIVYLTDQPQRGRSPWLPGDGSLTATSVSFVQNFFTTVQITRLWPQAILHTQWPGTGLVGDSTFDAFYASEVQSQTNATEVAENNRNAGVALLDKIGPAIIVTHSQAGPYGWNIADLRPQLVKAVVALEPEGPPFVNEVISTGPARPYGITTLPIQYSPPVVNPAIDLVLETVLSVDANLSSCVQQQAPAKQLVNLSQFPVLMLTSEASYHAVYDYCTVNYMKQAGVQLTWLHLPDVGIRGNGHFSFMELNNLLIAPLVYEWMLTAASK